MTRLNEAIILVLLNVACIVSIVVASCGSQPRTVPPISGPLMDGIRDPLNRIPVHQDIIKEAAPGNVVVITHADATKSDAAEALDEVTKVRRAQDKQIADQAKMIADLRAEVDRVNSDTDKRYRRAVNWLRFACILAIAAGVALCFFVSKRLLAITFCAIATLGAIAVEGFISDYGPPIAIGALCVLTVVGLYYLYMHRRSNKQLVQTGEALINKLGGVDQLSRDVALRDRLDSIQCKFTKQLVDKWTPRLTG